jgi:PucR family transcriptional regulator, purine catabolism regulatory protein
MTSPRRDLREYDRDSNRTPRGSPVPLWLDRLLDDPGLGLELVAGRRGLRQRGPIRWVHASEIPDPTPWLEGGEILLTTGMGVIDSPELQRKLIAGLDGRGCAGVGFGVGICADEVPAAMREEAEARDLPLFTVPYAVPFIAVTKRISRDLFDEHYATLRGAVDLHRQVLATVLGGRGLRGVLDTVGRALPDHRCVVFDYYGQVLAASSSEGAPDVEPSLWEAVRPHLADHDRTEVRLEADVAIVAPVRLGEMVEAYLVMVGDRPPHEHELLLLEQALTGVSLELARGHSARESHRIRVDDVLEEVAGGRLGGAVLVDRLARIGIDPAQGYEVVCVAVPGDAGTPPVRVRSLCTAFEDALGAETPPVVGRRAGVLYAIVPAGTALDGVVAALRMRGWSRAVLGRSRTRHDADGLTAALRESHVAALSPGDGPVREIGALGLPGLLAGIDDSLGSEAFVEHILGPVLAHDREEGSDLLGTLAAYQRHGCRPGPAAEELCIHRHTLAYRLDRVRDLTGQDPRDGAHLLAFGLAIELHARAAGPPEAR